MRYRRAHDIESTRLVLLERDQFQVDEGSGGAFQLDNRQMFPIPKVADLQLELYPASTSDRCPRFGARRTPGPFSAGLESRRERGG